MRKLKHGERLSASGGKGQLNSNGNIKDTLHESNVELEDQNDDEYPQ